MKILVTGAAGLLSRHLVPLLATHPNVKKLILTDIVNIGVETLDGLNEYDIVFEKLDICNPTRVMSLFYQYHPDLVLHLAAYTNVYRPEVDQAEWAKCYRINALATYALVQAYLAAQSVDKFSGDLVYISTDYVFDGFKSGGYYTETDTPHPLNCYGLSKLLGEAAVATLGMGGFVIRTSFKPRPFKHPVAPADMFTSAGYVDEIASQIALCVVNFSDVFGVITDWQFESSDIDLYPYTLHVARPEKRTAFKLAQETNPNVNPIELAGIGGVQLPQDASLDTSRWQKIKQELGLPL